MDGTESEEEMLKEDMEAAKSFDQLPRWRDEFASFLKKNSKKNKNVLKSMNELEQFFRTEGTLDFSRCIKEKLLFLKRRPDRT